MPIFCSRGDLIGLDGFYGLIVGAFVGLFIWMISSSAFCASLSVSLPLQTSWWSRTCLKPSDQAVAGVATSSTTSSLSLRSAKYALVHTMATNASARGTDIASRKKPRTCSLP
jgi:hypothetical protein